MARSAFFWACHAAIRACIAAICSGVCADAEMGIAAMKKTALIKVPVKLERVKGPRLFLLLISKPWLILSVVTIRPHTLLLASSMLHSFLCIFDSDALGLPII